MEFFEFDTEFVAKNTYVGFCSLTKWFCGTSQNKAVPAANQLQVTPAAHQLPNLQVTPSARQVR